MHRLLALVVFQMSVCAAGDLSIKTVDQDPATMAEFHRVIEDAAGNGACRVRFPSGEWMWHCTADTQHIQKKHLTKWESDAKSFDKDAMEKWLGSNKVAAVQILIGDDIDPKIYFTIEKILRTRQIPYWLIRPDAANSTRLTISLYETNGTARVLPQSDHEKAGHVTVPEP